MKPSRKYREKPAENRIMKPNREDILKHQLNKLGKAGGFKDLRFGAKDKRKTEEERALQRHIVERLRHLDEVGFEYDADDPMNKAAFGDELSGKAARMRLEEKADGGIQADIVEEQFFGSAQTGNFKDVLSMKIAESKLKKLKRVEENEEQRGKLKTVDIAWTHNIRFMLEHFSSLKTLHPRSSSKALENRKSVSLLLEQLTSARRISPVDAKPRSTNEEKILNNLQSTLESRLTSLPPATSALANNSEVADKPSKSVGYLLRVLLRMPEHQVAVVAFIANELRNATFLSLKDVIHHLFLIAILVEHFQPKFAASQTQPFTGSYGSTHMRIFCPELVDTLTRLFRLATSVESTNMHDVLAASSLRPLNVRESMKMTAPEEYKNLALELSDPTAVIPEDHVPLIQLACLNRMLCLSTELHRTLSILLPSCVCTQLFTPLRQLLAALPTVYFPEDLRVRATNLLSSMESLAQARTPKPLVPRARLTILSSEHPEDSRTLKKFGLLPQLEPRFDEKLVLHRTKADSKRSLQRKVARERRGAMRELRRDGHSLACHQLKVTKASDAVRIQKTQAILNSLRTIED